MRVRTGNRGGKSRNENVTTAATRHANKGREAFKPIPETKTPTWKVSVQIIKPRKRKNETNHNLGKKDRRGKGKGGREGERKKGFVSGGGRDRLTKRKAC